MRKGFNLERQIDKLLKHINSLGYHGHKNHPGRTANGIYIAGEPFDYEIILPGYIACFDAKECHETVWRMLKKDIKQAENLKHCKNAGVDAFFLVYFYPLKKLLKIDVDKAIDCLNNGDTSIDSAVGEDWNIHDYIGNRYSSG